MTYEGSPSTISSPASADGLLPLDLPDGPTTGPCGPRPARASRSRRPAKGSEPMIQGICGRTYFSCGEPTGPLAAWESRLQARLATVGSTESALIWKAKATPAGRSISRLAPSTRHINDSDYTGSPWPTPTVADVTGGRKARSGACSDEPLLNGLMASTWSTPRATDGEKGGPNMSFGAGGTPLPAQMWKTPMASDSDGGKGPKIGMTITGKLPDGQKSSVALPTEMKMIATAVPPKASPRVTPSARDHKGSRTPNGSQAVRPGGQMLNEQMVETADKSMWTTPTSRDFTAGCPVKLLARRERMAEAQGNNGFGLTTGNQMLLAETAHGGSEPTGSSATTARRVGSPTPLHPCWLMGFEVAWLYLAPQGSAKPASRKRKGGSAASAGGRGSATP